MKATEIVLNERKRAEEIIASGDIGDRPGATLNLLARYYRQICGVKGKKLYKTLNDFMLLYYHNYNVVKWTDTIERFIKSAAKIPLAEIDYVPVTRSELDQIATLNSKRLERVMVYHAFACKVLRH